MMPKDEEAEAALAKLRSKDDKAFADYVAAELAAAEKTHGSKTGSIPRASGALPPDHRR